MNAPMIRRSFVVLLAGAAPVALTGSAEAGGLLFRGHGHAHGQQAVMLVQPVQTQAVVLVPAASNAHHLNVAPVTQLQLGTVPTVQTMQAPTTGLMLTSGASYYVVPGGTAAPASPAPGRTRLSVGKAVDLTDEDYHVLSLNLGQRRSNVKGLEDAIANEVKRLFGKGGLDPSQVETLAFRAAEIFLSGLVPEPVIKGLEPIIDKFVKRAVQDHQAQLDPDVPANPTNPTIPVVPAGGMTFNITGQITLTPAGTGNGNANGNGNGNGGAGTANGGDGTKPLIKDEDNLEPMAVPR